MKMISSHGSRSDCKKANGYAGYSIMFEEVM